MKIARTLGGPLALSHEVMLLRALRPLVKTAHALARQVVVPSDARRLTAALRASQPNARIDRIVRSAGAKAEAASSRPWGVLDRLGSATHDADKVRRRVPYDGRALLEQWSKDAAGLIKSLRDDVAEGVRIDVLAAQAAGTSADELAAGWVRKGLPVKFGTLEGRAKTIARHQLTSLHAAVQSTRARALGVSDFMWRTQADGKVRDAHVDLEGSRHAYASPPSEGLPGQPVNCRCWAESVISDDVAERLGVSFVPSSR